MYRAHAVPNYREAEASCVDSAQLSSVAGRLDWCQPFSSISSMQNFTRSQSFERREI
jgi:hypothetical protein